MASDILPGQVADTYPVGISRLVPQVEDGILNVDGGGPPREEEAPEFRHEGKVEAGELGLVPLGDEGEVRQEGAEGRDGRDGSRTHDLGARRDSSAGQRDEDLDAGRARAPVVIEQNDVAPVGAVRDSYAPVDETRIQCRREHLDRCPS